MNDSALLVELQSNSTLRLPRLPPLPHAPSVMDNVTPSAEMQIIQSPPAGTIVQQGSHQILLTATDAAGNVGHCSVYLLVQR